VGQTGGKHKSFLPVARCGGKIAALGGFARGCGGGIALSGTTANRAPWATRGVI